MLGAIRLSGWVVLTSMYATANGDRFVAWMRTYLLPKLAPGDIIVMDNLRAHHDRVQIFCDEKNLIDSARLGSDALSGSFECGPRALERVGGVPQVFEYVDEVEDDRDRDADALRGALDALQLVTIASTRTTQRTQPRSGSRIGSMRCSPGIPPRPWAPACAA